MEKKLVCIIRWPGLRKMFDDDISRSTIDRWIKAGLFPDKIRLGK
ncbi:TPA: AlpA family phage regulatory protein, partial [Legionella pneumophila subsp. pneumophila]|nr:AlpA family phage regulatory protein [Legionella pneumophila subsp. pneumophila]